MKYAVVLHETVQVSINQPILQIRFLVRVIEIRMILRIVVIDRRD